MLRATCLICLSLLVLSACGHARIEEEADPGGWSRQIPDLLRQTAEERGIIACRLRAPRTDEGEAPCDQVELAETDKLYVTTAIKQERGHPDPGFELNYVRDVWTFCFIVVRGETSVEYIADFRRGVIGPGLIEQESDTPDPARVVVSMAPGYLDSKVKDGCDWLWNFTEEPQKG